MHKRIGYLQTSDGIRPHAMSAMHPIATVQGISRIDAKCRVEMWRGGFRQNISVAASFV